MIDHTARKPDVIVVRGDGDILAAKGRISSTDDANDVLGESPSFGGVAYDDVRDDLEVGAAVARRLDS